MYFQINHFYLLYIVECYLILYFSEKMHQQPEKYAYLTWSHKNN
jgi:hypothetical protein